MHTEIDSFSFDDTGILQPQNAAVTTCARQITLRLAQILGFPLSLRFCRVASSLVLIHRRIFCLQLASVEDRTAFEESALMFRLLDRTVMVQLQTRDSLSPCSNLHSLPVSATGKS